MSYKSINLDFNVVLNYPMGAVDNTCADFLDGCGVVGSSWDYYVWSPYVCLSVCLITVSLCCTRVLYVIHVLWTVFI